MLDLVGVGFFGFMRCTALSAGSDVMTQSYRKPCDTRSPKGVDGLEGVGRAGGMWGAMSSLGSKRKGLSQDLGLGLELGSGSGWG